MSKLDEYREQINQLDSEIVNALADRFNLSREIAALKKKEQIGLMHHDRIEQVKNRCAILGEKKNLRPEFIRDLFGRIIEESCYIQEVLLSIPNDSRPPEFD